MGLSMTQLSDRLTFYIPRPCSKEELRDDKLSMDGANYPTMMYQEL
jgi:hypothetical protein